MGVDAGRVLPGTEPTGVRSVVLSGPCLDARAWQRDQRAWLEQMPSSVRDTITTCEAEGRTDSPEYLEATMAFYRKHFCRLDPGRLWSSSRWPT